MHNKIRFRNDFLLLIIILVVAVIGFWLFKSGLKSGNTVLVTINGKEEYKFDISDDKEFTVKTGANGDNINILVIENGKVYIKEADCRDKICVNHRAISNSGETIVCLPHKLVVSVEE